MVHDNQVSLPIFSLLFVYPCIKYHEGKDTNFFSDKNILAYSYRECCRPRKSTLNKDNMFPFALPNTIVKSLLPINKPS